MRQMRDLRPTRRAVVICVMAPPADTRHARRADTHEAAEEARDVRHGGRLLRDAGQRHLLAERTVDVFGGLAELLERADLRGCGEGLDGLGFERCLGDGRWLCWCSGVC